MMPVEIDRWRPEQIDEVFAACSKQQEACTQASDSLHNPEVIEGWGGSAATAAHTAANKHRVDLDNHGAEIEAVKSAISRARAEVVSVKGALSAARAEVSQRQFVLDDATGTVSLNGIQQWMVTETTVRTPERVAEEAALIAAKNHAQQSVNAAMSKADAADRDLAIAIQAATGDVQLPDSAAKPEYVSPPAPGQLPGEPSTKYHEVAREPNSTKTSRIVKVEVPKGFNDPNLSSDLAQKYARNVTFDPTSPGVTGKLSQDMLKHSPNRYGAPGKDLPIPARPDTGEMDPKAPRTPSTAKTLDVSVEQIAQVRAAGATPTGMHEVQVDGHHYLEIDYQYNYEGKQVDIYGVNGIKLPSANADTWAALDSRDVQFLGSRGVQIPAPGQ